MSQGQMVAIGSALLLVASLFLAWGGISVDIPELPEGVPVPEGVGDAASVSGWESQNTLDLYLAIVAALVGINVLMAISGNREGLPFAPAAATFLLGAIGTLLVAYVVIDVPEGGERKIGLFLALIAVIGVTVGSYLQMRDDAARDY